MDTSSSPYLRISKLTIERITKDEFVLLSFLLLEGPQSLDRLNRKSGIGIQRLVRAASGLKAKDFIMGRSTKAESLELMPLAYPVEGQVICRIPSWVITDIKSRAADKQLLTYYFREGENFKGTLAELAEGIGMKKRNANYILEFLEKENIIQRRHDGNQLHLQLLERPKKGLFNSLFG